MGINCRLQRFCGARNLELGCPRSYSSAESEATPCLVIELRHLLINGVLSE
jgi:hypothetical protein